MEMRMRNLLKASIWGAAVALGMGVAAPVQAAPVPVALELSLLIDVSGSVDSTEYALQMTGYVNAFNSVAVQNAITALAPSGGVAVNVVQWSGGSQQSQVVPWTHLTNASQASAFATAISGVTRAFSGSTAPGSAINFAVNDATVSVMAGILNNDFTGTRLVIDVSGDGAENDGSSTSAARDAAALLGITINGLPILDGDPSLATWYQTNIQTAGGFTLPAATFATFNTAVQTKLAAEISGENPIPEPATMALLGTGLLGLGFLRRRTRAVG